MWDLGAHLGLEAAAGGSKILLNLLKRDRKFIVFLITFDSGGVRQKFWYLGLSTLLRDCIFEVFSMIQIKLAEKFQIM